MADSLCRERFISVCTCLGGGPLTKGGDQKIGQKILANDEICILEAMKMEQSIRSSIPGTVKTIHAEEGSTVSGGDIIVRLE